MRFFIVSVAALLVAVPVAASFAQPAAPPYAVTPNPMIVVPINPPRTAPPPPKEILAPQGTPERAACGTADPALTPAQVVSTSKTGSLNKYTIASSVYNRGAEAQLHTVVQRVEFYVDGNRVGVQTVPHVGMHRVYHFAFSFTRSADAGAGSSTVTIKLVLLNPADRERDDCNTADDTVSLRV